MAIDEHSLKTVPKTQDPTDGFQLGVKVVKFQPLGSLEPNTSSTTFLAKHSSIYTQPNNALLGDDAKSAPYRHSFLGHGMAASVLPKELNNNEPWRGLLPALQDKRGPGLNHLATWSTKSPLIYVHF